MARNIEIKARASDFPRQAVLARELSDSPGETLVQDDTYFVVPFGRLKLRVFGNGTGELIQYERKNTTSPKLSRYICLPTPEPERLKAALTRALGIRTRVRKQRRVHHIGATRIHLDQVEDLGEFIELEVLLGPDDPHDFGIAVAEDLMARLEIRPGDLLESSYVDLIEEESA